MSKFDGDIFKVEIGKSIIPYANSIIDEIKSLRSNIKENLEIEVPLIRLTDNELISNCSYRVLFKNDVITHRELDEKNISGDITSVIKDLEEVITNNVKELVE